MAPPNPRKLADLAAAPYNPRTISIGALDGLSYSMAEFGDLSGIVWNQRTGHLVAGHQRVKSLRKQYGDLDVVVADGDGGSVTTPEGHRFSVRVVDWPEGQEKAANVAANAPTIQGEFTDDLGSLLDELAAAEPDAFDALHLDDMGAIVDDLALGSLADDVDRLRDAGEHRPPTVSSADGVAQQPDWSTPPPDGDGEGREFDESAAVGVKMLTCPECGHEWPA